jgi:4-hydroxy-4-methyl-2-oxoglutarate aldolase
MRRPAWLFNLNDDQQGVVLQLANGVNTRIFAGTRSMLSLVRIDPHSEGALHQHPEEQWGFLLMGECVRIQDGQEALVAEGDFWHTPGNVPHGVRTGDSAALILDVFSPPRAEYCSPSTTDASMSGVENLKLFAQAAKLGAATLCDAAGRVGALPTAIQQIYGGRLSGPAFTVTCSPGDNLWLHRAIYKASPGDVLVASTGNSPEAGYWGDVLNRAAISRSLGGLVLDGCVRDGRELEQQGFPIFATGRCILGTSKCAQLSGSMGQQIRIGDCTINPGDLIVGDPDGVVTVKRDDVDAILADACRRHEFEEQLHCRLQEGERTVDLLNLV